MADSDPKQQATQPKVGRSYADLGVEVIQIMGRLGPVTIIVAGLLFAFYMFYQVLADTRLDADKQSQAKLDAAQKALVETYDSISTLSQKQITSVEKMLELHEKLTQATEKRRTQLEEVQTKAEEDTKAIRAEAEAARAEAQLARAEVERLKAEAEAARADAKTNLARAETLRVEAEALRAEAEGIRAAAATAKAEAEAARSLAESAGAEAKTAQMELERTRQDVSAAEEKAETAKRELEALNRQMAERRDQAKKDLEKLEADRKKLQAERDKVRTELEKRRQTLKARSDEIEALRGQLETLATQVTSMSDIGILPSDEGERLAQKILEQNTFRSPRTLLRAAAAKGDKASLEALLALIGAREEDLVPLFEEGMGFEAWMRFEYPSDSVVMYLGIRESTKMAHLSSVFIFVDTGQVFDVLPFETAYSIRLPNIEDWNQSRVFTYLEFYDGQAEPRGISLRADLDRWNLETVERAGAEEFGDTLFVQTLHGQVPELEFLTLDAFAKDHPERFADLRGWEPYGSGMDLGRRMIKRAESFDARTLIGMNHLEPHAGLPERFSGLLAEAVARSPGAQDYLAPYSSTYGALGPIAAAVLSDDFTIDAATTHLPGEETIQQALQVAGTKDNGIWVQATALSTQAEGALRRYNFNFIRNPAEDGAWQLFDFFIEYDLARRGSSN